MEIRLTLVLLFMLWMVSPASCCGSGCLRCNNETFECGWCDQHHYYSLRYKSCISTCGVSIAHTSTHGGLGECLDQLNGGFLASASSIYVSVYIIAGVMGFFFILFCFAAMKNRKRWKVFNHTGKSTRTSATTAETDIPTEVCCQDLEVVAGDIAPISTQRTTGRLSERKLTRGRPQLSESEDY